MGLQGNGLAPMLDADSTRALAVFIKMQFGDMGMGQDCKVRPAFCRAEIGAAARPAFATFLRT